MIFIGGILAGIMLFGILIGSQIRNALEKIAQELEIIERRGDKKAEGK